MQAYSASESFSSFATSGQAMGTIALGKSPSWHSRIDNFMVDQVFPMAEDYLPADENDRENLTFFIYRDANEDIEMVDADFSAHMSYIEAGDSRSVDIHPGVLGNVYMMACPISEDESETVAMDNAIGEEARGRVGVIASLVFDASDYCDPSPENITIETKPMSPASYWPWYAALVDESGTGVDDKAVYDSWTQEVDWALDNPVILHPLGSWDVNLHVGYTGGGAPDTFRFKCERP